MIDLHCHILPGLDDGPEEMSESVEMARMAAADGIRTTVATPHVLDGRFEATGPKVLKTLDELKREVEREGIDIELLPGSDAHVSDTLLERMDSGDVLTVGNAGRYVLLEVGGPMVVQALREVFFELGLRRVLVVLTHPERNPGVQHDPQSLMNVLEGGCVVQITSTSITGGFGREAQECSRVLLEHRMAHVVASDAHGVEGRPPVLSAARAQVEAILGDEARYLFEDNPAAVIEGKEVPYNPEPQPFRRKFFGLF